MINFAVNTACKTFIGTLPDLLKSAFIGRFFAYYLLLFLCSFPHTSNACDSRAYDRTASARHIIDGDTLVLSDGRKLRLIGIDTPELARKGRPAESGTDAARLYLSKLLKDKDRLGLKYGPERKDRHGRLLAHLFLEDGSNIQAGLLREGLALPLNIPPNVLFSDCYEEQMLLARAAGRGLWQLPQFQTIRAKSMQPDTHGYRLVHGVVSKLGFSDSAVWLNLNKHLAIRIRRKHLSYLAGLDLNNIIGAEIEVRGVIYQRNKQMRVSVRHKNDLKILK